MQQQRTLQERTYGLYRRRRASANWSNSLLIAQMLIHAHGSCTATVSESALEADWQKNPSLHRELEPGSTLRLDFQSDALPTELTPPLRRQLGVKPHQAIPSPTTTPTVSPTSPPAAALLDNSLLGCVIQNVDTSLKQSNHSIHSECGHPAVIVQ